MGWWNIEKEVLRFQHNDQDSILKLDKENYEREETNRGRIEDLFPNSSNVSHQPMREVPVFLRIEYQESRFCRLGW
jgi:hypothetical protein